MTSLLYGQEDTLPAPYKPDEFPTWTLDLRRAEIVTLGSFPISFMLTALVYDIVKAAEVRFDPAYPFGSNRSQDDIKTLLLVSGGISLTIGLTDFIIHQIKRAKKNKEQRILDEQRKNNGEPAGLTENES